MKKPKAGVSWQDAQKQGFSQVFGCPGIAFARKGRHYNSALVEVDDTGNPIEPPVIDAGSPVSVADAADLIAATTESAGADEDLAKSEAQATADFDANDEGEDTVADAVDVDADAADTTAAVPAETAEVLELRKKVDAAQVELDAWVKINDANTPAGKKGYAKLYGRVRRAKDVLAKAGGKAE